MPKKTHQAVLQQTPIPPTKFREEPQKLAQAADIFTVGSTNCDSSPDPRETMSKELPKRGKRGYVDRQDRIWVKDYAHADVPDHWDVQVDGGKDYFRIDAQGGRI